jgi:hypothetical protein
MLEKYQIQNSVQLESILSIWRGLPPVGDRGTYLAGVIDMLTEEEWHDDVPGDQVCTEGEDGGLQGEYWHPSRGVLEIEAYRFASYVVVAIRDRNRSGS